MDAKPPGITEQLSVRFALCITGRLFYHTLIKRALFFSPSPFARLFVGWLYCRQILQACFSLQLYVKVLCDPRRTGYKPVLEQTGSLHTSFILTCL